jgi:ATP-binding cassette subfamily B protein
MMKKTLKYVKPYAKRMTAGLIVKFIGSIAELFIPLILEYIIDSVVPLKDMVKVIVMGFAMLAFSLVALFGNIIANRLSVRVAGNMTHDLRYDLFKKTSYLKSEQVDEVTTPSLISRMTSDTYYVNQMVARSLRLGVRAPILLIGGIILTFVLDWRLALVLVAAVPFVIVAIVIITKKSVPCYFDIQQGSDNVVRSLQENISGVRVVKALSKGEYEQQKFHSLSDRLASIELKANKIMSLTNPLVTLILNVGLVAVIVVGALLSADAGKVLAFLSYFTIILNAMLGISKIFVVLTRGVASAKRIEQVLDLDEKQSVEAVTGDVGGNGGEGGNGFNGGDDNSLSGGEGACGGFAVEFKGVSFSYNGRENNLTDISFAIKNGQTLGIIGATGSGKSTIINLLMRFYDVGGGSIYVDGVDIRCCQPDELRKKFGVAFQNDFLMASTVRENVDYGRNLTDEQIEFALDNAQAKEFVDGLDGRLDFVLAQKASNLSGGQKQRLLIARALAGHSHIIILDDASSALDYATDAKLRKALADNYADCTKIIIAQRISSIMSADNILVLDDGRAIGYGTHEELMGSCEEYRNIFETQMGM